MKPFEIARVFDARRDRVWKAWTEAERLKQWWGPAGFTVHTCKVDLRPGGVFRDGMKQGWTGTMDQFAGYLKKA